MITGVGPGLGASLARRFAQGGYAIAINARRPDYLRSLAEEIRATGGEVLEVPADMGDRAQVEAAFKTIREQLGSPELLLYNAGNGAMGTIIDMTPEQFEAMWRVNGFGAFLSAKAVAARSGCLIRDSGDFSESLYPFLAPSPWPGRGSKKFWSGT